MPTAFPEFFAALAHPFEAEEVRVLVKGGRNFHYVTARTVMNRLDDICGPENWFDDYLPHENSVICRLTIVLPDGRQLTKVDAGGYAGMADAGDDDKSGYSDAFKRAAAKHGVGRYLWRDGVPSFARDPESSHSAAPASQARPAPTDGGNFSRPRSNGHANGLNGHTNGQGEARQYDGPPKSGKALFAWVREQEQRHEIALLKYASSWAKLQDFPGRMVEWSPEQVALAFAELSRKLETVGHEGPSREPGSD